MVQQIPSDQQQPQEAFAVEEDPIYVNARQYQRIIKRRQQRAKLEMTYKIPKERSVSSLCRRFYIQ